MLSIAFNLLADLSAQDIARLRLISMFIVLIGGLVSGYLAGTRFGLPEHFAKKIMTVVLVCFNWLIALLVIWPMKLSLQLIWLPIIGFILMMVVTAFSAAVFSRFKLARRSRLTIILAAGLSNLGYTGGAFVCYALFGARGLALANIYPVLWVPAVYLIFFPLLKFYELRSYNFNAGFKLTDVLDFRFIVIPAVGVAVVLNLADIKPLRFVAQFHIIDILVYVASALAFFAIGLRVKLSRLKNHINLYFPLAAIKFILTPAIAILLIWILAMTGRDLTDLIREVVIVLSVTPSAVLMVTMSNVFDLDAPLASALWVVTMAIFAVVVVPVLFLLLT
jgi:predicted permease